jgi:hypothetical protein
MELAADGMLTGVPAAKGAVAEVLVMGMMVGVQGAMVVLQPVEVTYAVGLLVTAVAVLTVKLIEFLG